MALVIVACDCTLFNNLSQIFVAHFQDNNKIIKWPKTPKK
jgi:hypothetical protein